MTTTPTQAAQRFVTSTDGVRIAVYEQGTPDGPTLVLAHGWPDSHLLWDSVVPLLTDRFRVITYDNRGSGASSVPKRVAEYGVGHYADDFSAVIEELSPHRRVHVLGHDWGSVGVWEYLSRAGAGARLASFTSVSGPSADHIANYILGRLAQPWRPIRFVRGLSQGLRLLCCALFSIPVIPPLVVRAFGAQLLRQAIMVGDGIPENRLHQSANYAAEAANGMKVYPATFFRTAVHARTDHYVDVPIQVIVNTKDPFIRAHLFDDTPRWVARLWRRDLKAGHWSPFSHPQVLAAATAELVEFIEGKPASRALLRAQVGRQRQPFGDMLVSVTGAGSGIGRATALEFSRLGAELIVSDIDEVGVKETAAAIGADGGLAHAYTLNVADADAVEAFADDVCAEHGVPDIVVNNAGVGHTGGFLDTPRGEYDRVLDINFGGVVHGCRVFGRRLVDRGTGGHIVNISSMAAYSPQQSMNAYATSKAAVFMFSDCLRAELAAADVGLTIVCPGVINTNIVNTSRFDAPPGKEGKVEARRELIAKVFAARGYSPDKVAKAIVSAVTKNKSIRPVSPESYFVYAVAHLLPLAMRISARARVM
jgi:NAD(P)-dependent dehydrogenase (short-subunit alcohol dehydrogenase family)/pimeloyl-ACP methyl ester carboxylesterase